MIIGKPSPFIFIYLAVKGDKLVTAFHDYDEAVNYEKNNPGIDILCCRQDMLMPFYDEEKKKHGIKIDIKQIREAWRDEAILESIFGF